MARLGLQVGASTTQLHSGASWRPLLQSWGPHRALGREQMGQGCRQSSGFHGQWG